MLKLWASQDILLQERKHKNHILAAGVGYGKSIFGCRWLLTRILWNSKPLWYGVLNVTYSLLKGVNLEQFKALILELGMVEGIHYKVNYSELFLEFKIPPIKRARIYFITAQNYKRIIAYTLAGVWLDEPGWMDDAVWSEVVKRCRDGKANIIQTLRTGVPQGMGESEYFKEGTSPDLEIISKYKLKRAVTKWDDGEFVRFKSNKKTLIMHASTHENTANADSYIYRLADDFGWSKSLWSQQVHGQFVSASQISLFDFDEAKHVGEYPPSIDCKTRWVSWDFNVGQVTWIVGEQRDGKFLIVAENGSDAIDTMKAVEQFIKKFPLGSNQHIEFLITGDCNGYSSDTRSTTSDYSIIVSELKTKGYRVKLIAPRSNPSITTSVMACNKLFNENTLTSQKVKMYIDKSCKKLIMSLKQTKPDGRGGIAKPSGDTWTHPSDAFRYFVDAVAPIRSRGAGGFNY
jgi:hypothetical protein